MESRKKLMIAVFIAGAAAAGGGLAALALDRMQTAETAETPVTLDWYINYSWFSQGWGENAVSKAITEATGVAVRFETPAGDETEKLGALIASDNLPDLVTLGWWEPQLTEMIDAGLVWPLDELAESYAPDFYEHTDPTVVRWYTLEDGSLYCYPNSFTTPQDLETHDDISSNQVFLVRKDIYEAIGSPDMTTREGFAAAVRAAVEAFPEVDGEPLIPVGCHNFNNEGCVSFDLYLENFLAIPYEKDGALYDRHTDPEVLEWLKMFRELNEEGYLLPEIFINQRSQTEELFAAGRIFCCLYQYTDMTAQQTARYEADPDSCYIAIDGPRNENGAPYEVTSGGINGWTVTLITKNCKDPEKAIRFLDYMISEEGQKMVYLGPEGVTYETKDGKPVMFEDVQTLHDADRSAYDSLYGADDTYWMLQNNIMQMQWEMEDSEALQQLKAWSRPYVIYNGQYDVRLPSESAEAKADEKITALWAATIKKLLLAPSEEAFDRIVADFKTERDALGYDEVQKAKWEAVQEAKEKLGI